MLWFISQENKSLFYEKYNDFFFALSKKKLYSMKNICM